MKRSAGMFPATVVVVVVMCLVLLRGAMAPALAAELDFGNISDADTRKIFYPSLVSGDDVREGTITERQVNISRMLRNEPETPPGAVFPLAAMPPLRPKAGLFCGAPLPRHPVVDELMHRLPAMMQECGLVPVPSAELHAVFGRYPWRDRLQGPPAIGRFLAEYPGSRFLFYVRGFSLPAAVPGEVRLDCLLVDGESGAVYPSPVFRRPVYHPSALTGAVPAVFQDMLRYHRLQLTGAAWSTKIFLVQNNLAYIGAGRLSGLVPARELTVNGPGRPLIDPRTGTMVGFVPGEVRARLRVRRLFGPDLAEVEVVSGGPVRMGNVVHSLQ
ncbi:MAG: hypothetical protein JW781_07970 [Deltaproteobacteria bacterium]|nr:hypothetical protein [Candidatus Anaeroferrophillacea bacterium]